MTVNLIEREERSKRKMGRGNSLWLLFYARVKVRLSRAFSMLIKGMKEGRNE